MASGIRYEMAASIVPQGTAGTTQATVLGRARRAGILAAARFLPVGAGATSGTNYRTWTIQNRGQDGTGTTTMATLDTSAVSNVAYDERAFTLSGTAANLVVAEGDIIAVVETVAGSGLAHTGARVEALFDPA